MRSRVRRAPRPRSRASAADSPASCTTASRRNWPSSAAAPAAWPRLPDGVEILGAAERALEDSRRAIEALVPPAHEPLDVALERLGARLATECGRRGAGQRPRHDRRAPRRGPRGAVRIISEAVRNAAHHGGARHVRVDMHGHAAGRPRSSTTAAGFRDGANSGLGVAGYGLIAMRERAEQVGGQFSLESVRGAGTLVQVVLP